MSAGVLGKLIKPYLGFWPSFVLVAKRRNLKFITLFVVVMCASTFLSFYFAKLMRHSERHHLSPVQTLVC